jgi:putative membrane-bound dehydrogenase-like protein
VFLWSLGFGFWSFSHAATTNLNGHTFTLPDGFTVELVAAAPLVNRPISIAFDEKGRLYATDSSGSSDKGPTQYERKDHRIVRLEDTDGDGRFDKSVVFADKMMFPEGAMFYEGSLYVAAPPQIWKLTDTDGDGVADKREVWHDGKTLTGCANDLHGPYLGPDGWIYWTKGAFAEQRYTLANGKPFVTRASHIFRARPDGTGIEPVLTGGMDNPVGVAFHSTGERFLSCTFVQPGGGKRDGLLHAIYGGVYGKEQAALDGHPRTGDLMPVMNHSGASAPCGLTMYRSRVLGADWADNLLACYFNLRKVVRHELLPDGATFKTRDTDLLASDHLDFHPTDVLEDADGSILIADTGGWYKICCPTSQLAKPDVLGGIYRLRKAGMPKREDPRGLKLNWPALKPADLAKLLADDRLHVRQRATHELGKRGESALPVLRDVLVAADVRRLTSNAKLQTPNSKQNSEPPHVGCYPEETRLAAVWSLARIPGSAAREVVRTALNDTDASVRHAALHVVSLWRDTNAVGRVESFLDSSSTNAALVRVAAETAGRLGSTNLLKPLLSATHLASWWQTNGPSGSETGRRVLLHSLTFALMEVGQPGALHEAYGKVAGPCGTGLFDTFASLVIACLTARDQMGDKSLAADDLVVPFRFASRESPGGRAIQETIVGIWSRRPEWASELVGQLRARLAEAHLEIQQDELSAMLPRLAKAPVIQSLLADTLRDRAAFSAEAQLLALRAMAGAGLKDTPPRWLDELPSVLADTSPPLVRQAALTARSLPWPKGGHAALAEALGHVGRNANAPTDIRVEALAAIPGGLASADTKLFDFLLGAVQPSQPVLTRSAAAGVLAKAKLTDAQRLALADTMKSVSPLDAPKLLPAFDKSPNETLGLKLVAALKESTGLRGLRVDLLKPLLAKYPKPVQDAGAELLATLNADAGKQRAHLEALLPTLTGGDVARGMAVFNSQKSACFTCHAIGYRGGKLGPDLTRIGQVRTEMDLLESIVFPSASFVRSYEPFTVVVKGGEDVTGIVRKDAPDEVILANGPETEARIARADVVEMRPGKVSLMPDGMEQALTKQELADLLAFLKASK